MTKMAVKQTVIVEKECNAYDLLAIVAFVHKQKKCVNKSLIGLMENL